MRVVYVAKHHQKDSNDDEGAIAHALTQLGHRVVLVPESQGATPPRGDILLFHKWSNTDQLKKLNGKMLRAFWYFDLVGTCGDSSYIQRSAARMRWMHAVTPNVDIGFCTDGDWVDEDLTGKLRTLHQGFDSRLEAEEAEKQVFPMLFVGGLPNGSVRAQRFQELKQEYGDQLVHMSSGVYRESLAVALASAAISVALDSPVTNRYWSNRVYNSCGLGAFTLHPYCAELAEEYQEGKEIAFYSCPQEFREKVLYYSRNAEQRQAVAQRGRARTLKDHTYYNRCKELMKLIKEAGA